MFNAVCIRGNGCVPTHELAQKERDARWTLKRDRTRQPPEGMARSLVEIAVPAFDYKNQLTIDRRHDFIRRFAVSSAAEHDSRRFREVMGRANTGSEVWVDTGYRSRKSEVHMARHGLRSKIHFRKSPGKLLFEPDARTNASRSKVRSAVEHVFAFRKGPMAILVPTVGIARARTKIGTANLDYNMRRLVRGKCRTRITPERPTILATQHQ